MKSALNKTVNEEQYQKHVEGVIKDFINNCEETNRVSCAEAVADLLIDGPYLHPDCEAFEMQRTMLDLLAFLANPEIAANFKENASLYSSDYADRLRRLIIFFDQLRNKLAFAQMHQAILEEGQYDIERLQAIERQYAEQSTPHVKKAA